MSKLSPEEILKQIQEKDDNVEKGKLKIFLGYCAGVGKTYHMLDLARDVKKSGKDVVVGYVEKHDRKETLELLDGMEILSTKEIEYKNITLNELNIETVLKRNPEIVIIDEYAHTNAHGSENEKRYQDILEILDKGIDVYTTLNVQHIESLNEKVRDITKVRIKEIVPDKYVKMADNIELIDIEPKELLNRMYNGKVYKKEKIQTATENFFTIENLTKLREITLKYMTGALDRKSVISSDGEIMLLLDTKEDNTKLINSAYEIANYFDYRWKTFYIGIKKNVHENNKKINEYEKHEVKLKSEEKTIKNLEGQVENTNMNFAKYVNETKVDILIISKKLLFRFKFKIYLLLKNNEGLHLFVI